MTGLWRARIAHAINSVETFICVVHFHKMRVLRMLLIALKQKSPYAHSHGSARIAHAINSVETVKTFIHELDESAYCACY